MLQLAAKYSTTAAEEFSIDSEKLSETRQRVAVNDICKIFNTLKQGLEDLNVEAGKANCQIFEACTDLGEGADDQQRLSGRMVC